MPLAPDRTPEQVAELERCLAMVESCPTDAVELAKCPSVIERANLIARDREYLLDQVNQYQLDNVLWEQEKLRENERDPNAGVGLLGDEEAVMLNSEKPESTTPSEQAKQPDPDPYAELAATHPLFTKGDDEPGTTHVIFLSKKK